MERCTKIIIFDTEDSFELKSGIYVDVYEESLRLAVIGGDYTSIVEWMGAGPAKPKIYWFFKDFDFDSFNYYGRYISIKGIFIPIYNEINKKKRLVFLTEHSSLSVGGYPPVEKKRII